LTRAIAVLSGAALAAASATLPVRDTDLFWHLATAREALAHGLVRSDLFSWTIPGAAVPTDQWLGQLILYSGYAIGSWHGVLVVRTVAVAALVGLTAAAALVRVTPRPAPVIALATAIPAIVLSRALWTERPELFGAALFAALVLLLQLKGRAPLFAIAPLLVVWANVHGSFALGSGLVLLVAAYGLRRDPALRLGYAAAAAGAIASFVLTPAGLSTFAAPGLHLLEQPRQIAEEMVPDPRTAAGALWALVLGATVATAALSHAARWRDVILVVPTALLSLVAIRYTPLFAIAATPYLAAGLPEAVGSFTTEALRGACAAARSRGAPLLRGRVPAVHDAQGAESPGRRAPEHRSGATRGNVAAAPALMLTSAAILFLAAIALAPREPEESFYPVSALVALPEGPGLFHEYDWGGWLIWRAPATPVFIDGRLNPYRPDVLRDYVTLIEAHPGWRDVVARRGIRWILVRPAQPIAVRARDLGWSVLARSPAFVLIEIPQPRP